MKTIVVPTDFSPAAYNAAQYAIGLAAQLGATRMILYNAYQQYISEDPAMLGFIPIDTTELKKISEEGLAHMQKIILPDLSSQLHIETISDYNTVTNGIIDLCKEQNADLVIMGITGASGKLEQVVIGSNAIDVSRHSKIPVIIVPADAKYKPLKRVLLACDFKKILETTPVGPIKEILDATHAELHVLHVDANANDFKPDTPFENLMLEELFRDYNPQYHNAESHHFAEAINQSATANEIDMIIVIPKRHGLFEGIFKRSHTKELAFHSHISLMTIHE
jgi:nucleotide-binding universal stress UspA family protein